MCNYFFGVWLLFIESSSKILVQLLFRYQYARWITSINKFDFRTKHKAGNTNKEADVLGRKHSLTTVLRREIIVFEELASMMSLMLIFTIFGVNVATMLNPNDFHIVDGYLFKSNVLSIPHTSLHEQLI